MNKHLQKIIYYVRGIITQLTAWYKELSRYAQIGVAAAAVLVVVLAVRSFGGDVVEVSTATSTPLVRIASVSDLTNKDTDLPLVGIVTSTSEATIRSESSGKLTKVYKRLGDTVIAGQIIAEIENSGERASMLQAEGAYDAARASRDIARINSGTTNTSLGDTQSTALNTISSAYTTMDDVIRVKTTAGYSNADNIDIRFLPSVPDQSLVNSLETKRQSIEVMLLAREARNKTLTSSSDLVTEVGVILKESQTIKLYLDDLATAYNKALPDSTFSQAALDAAKASVGVARGSISGTISSLTLTKTALTSSIAAQEISGKTVTSGDANIATSDAAVKSALGAYNAALSRLEKTIIRSPITGTLNSLSIETGDFVTSFAEVAVVSNNGALEVISYVTDEDARRITVGNPVKIEDTLNGVITRKAQAIDPRTKKIEVRIGITDKAATLVNGQSVHVVIGATKSTAVTQAVSGPVKVPLSALKLTPQGAFVFTVSASSTLVAIPVQEGAILGDQIQITSGLSGSEVIVVDARGLKANLTVTVQE